MDKKERDREKRLKLLSLIGVLLIVRVSLVFFPALQNIYYQHRQFQEAEAKREELKKQENVVEMPCFIPDAKRKAEQEDRPDEKEHPDSLKPEEGLKLYICHVDEVFVTHSRDWSVIHRRTGTYTYHLPSAGVGHRMPYSKGIPGERLSQQNCFLI